MIGRSHRGKPDRSKGEQEQQPVEATDVMLQPGDTNAVLEGDIDGGGWPQIRRA